ncbi:hypothetical protein AXF23_14655 [Prevotella sp. oral taxon 313]|jgi:hypothetical protein|nr:hypothetical protein AXF23_14655 [Prevotella sp. oral taxon 313]
MVEENKPVMPTLKRMKVGDTEIWPIERLDVVRVTTGRISAIKRREGWKFQMKTLGLVVEVTRIS